MTPDHGTNFNVKGMFGGLIIESKQDTSGKDTEVILYEPGEVTGIKKKQ